MRNCSVASGQLEVTENQQLASFSRILDLLMQNCNDRKRHRCWNTQEKPSLLFPCFHSPFLSLLDPRDFQMYWETHRKPSP